MHRATETRLLPAQTCVAERSTSAQKTTIYANPTNLVAAFVVLLDLREGEPQDGGDSSELPQLLSGNVHAGRGETETTPPCTNQTTNTRENRREREARGLGEVRGAAVLRRRTTLRIARRLLPGFTNTGINSSLGRKTLFSMISARFQFTCAEHYVRNRAREAVCVLISATATVVKETKATKNGICSVSRARLSGNGKRSTAAELSRSDWSRGTTVVLLIGSLPRENEDLGAPIPRRLHQVHVLLSRLQVAGVNKPRHNTWKCSQSRIVKLSTFIPSARFWCSCAITRFFPVPRYRVEKGRAPEDCTRHAQTW